MTEQQPDQETTLNEAQAGRRRAVPPRQRRTAAVAAGGVLLLIVVSVVVLWPRGGGGHDAAPAGACEISSLRVGVATPVTAPWFAGDPADGSGFESALVKELSRRLHVEAKDVRYVAAPGGRAVTSGGAKQFDIAISQYRKTKDLQEVSFSRGYLAVPQAVLTTASGRTLTRLRDLRERKLAVVSGSDGAHVVTERVKPRQVPTTYGDLAGLVHGLRAGAVRTAVLDLPDAEAATRAAPNARLAGLIRPQGQDVETFRIVLPKDSTYAGCIDRALEDLDTDGVLAALEKQWLTGPRRAFGAPYLR